MESTPRVTLEMLESVQRTLHDYKRCFAVLFLMGDRRLPKDLLRMVWKSTAGSLEELQRKLQRRLVKQEFGYEGDDERQIQDCLLLLDAQKRAENETFHAGSARVNTSFVHQAERAEKALRTTWFCWQKLTPGQSLYVAKRLGLVEQDYMGEAVVLQDASYSAPRPPRRAKKRPKPVPFIDLT
jgi:hypothetical protein